MNATIKGTGASATLTVSHSDHLGSTAVVTDSNAEVEELLDYHPFGEISFNSQNTDHPEQRKFTGHEYDVDTGLNYMEARYYDPVVGRFLSQDPVFLALGSPSLVKNLSGFDRNVLFTDPQTLNSYSYARNNPLVYTDPQGNFIFAPLAYMAGIAAITYAPTAINFLNSLLTPLGQHAIVTSIDDYQKGNTTAAVVGVVTAGSGGGINSVKSLGSKPATSIYNTAVNNVLSKFPNQYIASRAEVIKVFGRWANTTFGTKTESIIYHGNRHVPPGETLQSLTNHGDFVWNSYVSNQKGAISQARDWKLGDGRIGVKVDMPDGTGGIFTKEGKIVTVWKSKK